MSVMSLSEIERLFDKENVYNFNDIQLSAKEVKAIEFIKGLTKDIDHSGSTFFEHLYKTFRILKNLKQTEDVCLAGLYHAAYDTQFFNAGLKINPETVVEYIGEYAEFLVQVYCLEYGADSIFYNQLSLSRNVYKDLLYILYSNEVEQCVRSGVDYDFFGVVKRKIMAIEKYKKLGLEHVE